MFQLGDPFDIGKVSRCITATKTYVFLKCHRIKLEHQNQNIKCILDSQKIMGGRYCFMFSSGIFDEIWCFPQREGSISGFGITVLFLQMHSTRVSSA